MIFLVMPLTLYKCCHVLVYTICLAYEVQKMKNYVLIVCACMRNAMCEKSLSIGIVLVHNWEGTVQQWYLP
jgi:hypothetical protein